MKEHNSSLNSAVEFVLETAQKRRMLAKARIKLFLSKKQVDKVGLKAIKGGI